MKAVKYLSFFLLAGALFAVETRENPGKPARPDAGRALELEAVQVIEGESESYFLAMPGSLKLDDHWVRTSTETEDQGWWFDLFDFDGKYPDRFYIKLPGRLIGLDGEYLYAAVPDDADNDKIVKYRMLNL